MTYSHVNAPEKTPPPMLEWGNTPYLFLGKQVLQADKL